VLANAESLIIRLIVVAISSGVAVSLLVLGLTVDILSTFCGVKLMLKIFEFPKVITSETNTFRTKVTVRNI